MYYLRADYFRDAKYGTVFRKEKKIRFATHSMEYVKTRHLTWTETKDVLGLLAGLTTFKWLTRLNRFASRLCKPLINVSNFRLDRNKERILGSSAALDIPMESRMLY